MRIKRLMLVTAAVAGLASGAACSGNGGSPTLADNGPSQAPPTAPTDTSGFVPPPGSMGH
jgi:hypothetical protein